MVAGEQLNVLQCEQQRPGEQVAGRIREARQEPLRNGQVPVVHKFLSTGIMSSCLKTDLLVFIPRADLTFLNSRPF
jgi:hypothetical protein